MSYHVLLLVNFELPQTAAREIRRQQDWSLIVGMIVVINRKPLCVKYGLQGSGSGGCFEFAEHCPKAELFAKPATSTQAAYSVHPAVSTPS